MQKKIRRAIVMSLLLHLVANAAPDGCWNGKPWKKEKLNTAVEAGDPEALAERAYRLRDGFDGEEFEQNEVYRLARKSAEAGSFYGMAILSRCFERGYGVKKDRKKAWDFATKAAEGNHPLGVKNFANLSVDGSPSGNAKWLKFTQKAAAGGCQYAQDNLYRAHYFATNGVPRNRKKAWRHALNMIKEADHLSLLMAQMIVHRLTYSKKIEEICKQRFVEAIGRLERASKVDLVTPMRILGTYYTRNGRSDRGVPILIRAEQLGDMTAKREVFGLVTSFPVQLQAGTESDERFIYKMARDLVSHGVEDDWVLMQVAKSWLWPGMETPVDVKKALFFANKTQELSPFCQSLHRFLGEIYFNLKGDGFYDKRRGVAHFIIASRQSPPTAAALAKALEQCRKPDQDLAKAYAVRSYCLKVRDASPEVIDQRLSKLKEALDPEQLEIAQDLVKRGYPTADEFMKNARDVLVEYGDLKKGTPYPSWRPYILGGE